MSFDKQQNTTGADTFSSQHGLFWHQCLSIFFVSLYEPAMVLCTMCFRHASWTSFIPYVIANFRALVGALICYVMYKDHFTESEGNVTNHHS